MAMTQFAMVEELASLIKDNLFCKHLVLSTEEILVNFLQSDSSPDGVLELQPMGPYQRLLLHRLADIYGFAHESVGEGDDRHLVLERSPESAIPSILVSDILWQYDEYQYGASHSSASSLLILRREKAQNFRSMQSLPPSTTFEEREAAYLAARERIFSLHQGDEKKVIAPKSRKVPVVAQRMIAHALGQKICADSSSQTLSQKFGENKPAMHLSNNGRNVDRSDSTLKEIKETGLLPIGELGACERKNDRIAGKSSNPSGVSATERMVQSKTNSNSFSKSNSSQTVCNEREVGIEHLERERLGAAKRIFAHALGLPSSRGNNGLLLKSNAREAENSK